MTTDSSDASVRSAGDSPSSVVRGGVVILVTHLLGTGHLARAAALGRALTRAGLEATVISGGRPAPHLRNAATTAGVGFVQLPPVASDGVNFRDLLDGDGRPVDAAYLSARRAALRDAMRATRPAAFVSELWPFGRRVLSDEFEAAFEALPRETARFCSIRDILAAPSKRERIDETVERATRHDMRVLIHGDPALAPLTLSWPGGGAPVPDELTERLVYTGYLSDPPPLNDGGAAGRGEILVAAGGGPVGDRLFAAAIKAAALDDARVWRLLVGGGAARLERLRAAAPTAPNLVIEGVRPDYRAMLARATCSVSQSGYNTALDLIAAAVPSVLVPFEEGGETEQRLRADALAERAGAVTVPEADLDGASLAGAVAKAVAAGAVRLPELRRDGAEESARLIAAAVAR